MITLKLPDGSERQVPDATRPREVAESIGKRLAQAAIAAEVNGQIIDLDRELSATEAVAAGSPTATFRLLTDKDRESLDVLRHSCAHVMARAIMRLFPGVKLAFGPTIENGYYYDVDAPEPIREDDFPRIEAEMRKIVTGADPFERFERPTAEARTLCADLQQSYKVEHIDDVLKQFPTVSFYRVGEFIDLCRGPHLPHAGKIGAFKILSIAGAYWKNDATRKQLQRLYGTAFFNQKDLDAYLTQVEEAKKRDHRVLGKQLKLFTISPLVGSGLILWMPKGATVRGLLETFIKEELIKRGYQPVYTPHIGRLELYRTSGHFPYYRDAQFPPLFLNPLGQIADTYLTLLESGKDNDDALKGLEQFVRGCNKETYGHGNVFPGGYLPPDDPRKLEQLLLEWAHEPAEQNREALKQWVQSQEGYLVKPMNCPHHIQIYKAEPRSYRDLPVRLAEFGTVYRFEQTGELSGMTRVRGFTQDDAHLFITPEQIEEEVGANVDLVLFVLSSLGLNDYRVRIGLRDPASDKYVGKPENWEKAEKTLIEIVKARGMNYSAETGEAAFYGPKIDFVVRDCIGREWQLGTVQLDYNLPERFGLEYVGKDNQVHRPVMIHRAPFGSMERFMGILIEHFAGAFPLWLAPEQVRVIPVRNDVAEVNEYVRKVESKLRGHGLRASADLRGEDMRKKIREGEVEKVPYLLVVGAKEQAAGTVGVRERGKGDLGAIGLEDFIRKVEEEVRTKQLGAVSTASAGFTDRGAKFSG